MSALAALMLPLSLATGAPESSEPRRVDDGVFVEGVQGYARGGATLPRHFYAPGLRIGYRLRILRRGRIGLAAGVDYLLDRGYAEQVDRDRDCAGDCPTFRRSNLLLGPELRAGLAFGRVMPYLRVGGGYARHFVRVDNTPQTDYSNEDHSGWFARGGAGVLIQIRWGLTVAFDLGGGNVAFEDHFGAGMFEIAGRVGWVFGRTGRRPYRPRT